MPECISIVLSLMCLMLANILIGKKLADLKNEYKKDKFVGGITKAFFSLIGLALTYTSALIFPMEVAEINGEMVTTLSGAVILLKAANLFYGGKVLLKMKDLLMVDTSINSINKGGK